MRSFWKKNITAADPDSNNHTTPLDDVSEQRLIVASNQITAVANQIGITLEDNKGFSQNIYLNAKEMAGLNHSFDEDLSGILTDISSFISHLKTIDQFSADMKDEGENSQSVLTESLTRTRSIVSEIHAINETTIHSVETMRDLKKLSADITQVLESVADISDQTKLLSLNATIESARAGAAGAGFGIVAQHIQRLSDESQNAVDNIHRLVGQLSDSMERVDRSLEDNVRKVKETSDKFAKVGSDLSDIQHSFDRLVNRCLTVRDEVVREQAQSSELQKKVTTLRDTSTKNLSRIDEVYQQLSHHHESMEELGDLGIRLSKAASDLQPLIDERAALPETIGNIDDALKAEIFTRIKSSLSAFGENILERQNAAKLCDSVLGGETRIEAAWINDTKGRFIYSNPPAGIANAKLREWFTLSVAGTDFVSKPYISAITGKACMTFATPIKKGSETIGVIGCDLHF